MRDFPMVAYLAASGAIFLFGGNLLAALIHALGIALIYVAKRYAPLLHAWYPIAMLGPLYGELTELSRIVWRDHAFDPLVQSWETALWGNPALTWSVQVPSLYLSEWLHLSYFSYYLLPWALGLLLWRTPHFAAYTWTWSLLILTTFLWNIFFPVQGPRPLLPPLDDSITGPFHGLVHWIAGKGAAGAAAFPSGHVGVSALMAFLAWRWHRTSFPLFAVLSASIFVATVYGRFHYLVDAFAGLAAAAFFAWFGPRTYPRE